MNDYNQKRGNDDDDTLPNIPPAKTKSFNKNVSLLEAAMQL